MTSLHPPVMKNEPLRISAEVEAALREGAPVVALESTIVAHGMPFPESLDTARRVEAAVRAEGAIPATIAIADGAIVVGLDEAELETLARAGRTAHKVSRRDLGYALAKRELGATTVSATMIGAHLAGIRVFATGGIGGVHRGGEQTLDISADLEELARTPVAVVCAGAKAILDLPRTLEALETRGVPVIGYQTRELPAFWSRHSGLMLEARVDSPEEAARVIQAHLAVGLRTGLVIAVPVPLEAEVPTAVIEGVIDEAIRAAEREDVRGKELTPYLLASIREATGGASLRANVALVENDARVAARIAKAMSAGHD